MKNTMKLILVITLFCSTTSIALADGDHPEGGRCETCSTSVAPGTNDGTTGGTNGDETTGTKENNENDKSSKKGIFATLEDLILTFWI